MINLLPPDIKEQIHFSRRNATTVRYVWTVAVLAALIAGGIGWGLLFLSQKQAAADDQLKSKQASIDLYKPVEEKAKTLNGRITAIKNIQKNQAKFSVLLDDIAKVTPRGVAIRIVTFTGDDKKPVQIQATTDSLANAVAFRDALVTSPRVSAADIQSVSAGTVTISLGFKSGQAK